MRSKTQGEVVNEVLMLSLVNGHSSVLIVEGVDDLRFWKTRIDGTCVLICADGKVTAKKAVDRLNKLDFKRHVAVLDRDYDDIAESTSLERNIIFWDAHSLETVLFESPAGDRALAEVFAPDWVRDLERDYGMPFKEFVAGILERFGRVRYLHCLRTKGKDDVTGLNLFRVFPMGAGIELNDASLFAEAERGGAIPSTVQGPAKLASVDGWERRYLIRGHDVGSIMNILAREAGLVYASDAAEANLRMSFQDDHFRATSVHADLLAWEALHRPYRVLPAAA